jgi:hypothetical protein
MKTIRKKQPKNPKFNPGKARLAVIHWLDAQDGEGGWTPISQVVKHELATVYDVGWIVYEDKKKIIIMGSMCWEGPAKKDLDGGRFCSIPKSWVNRIWYLDRGKDYENVRVQLMGQDGPKRKNSKKV